MGGVTVALINVPFHELCSQHLCITIPVRQNRDSPGSCSRYLYGSIRIRSELACELLSISSSLINSELEDNRKRKK